jgi:hypothetical protein
MPGTHPGGPRRRKNNAPGGARPVLEQAICHGDGEYDVMIPQSESLAECVTLGYCWIYSALDFYTEAILYDSRDCEYGGLFQLPSTLGTRV